MIEYSIDPGRRLVTTRVAGRFYIIEFASHLGKLSTDPAFDPTYNTLIVAESGTAIPSHSAFEHIGLIADVWSPCRNGTKCAILVPDAEAQRSMEFALRTMRLPRTALRSFVLEDHAHTWLSQLQGSS